MMRIWQGTTRIWQDEHAYLTLIMIVFLILPIAYIAYLCMNMSIYAIDFATLLNQNPVECINLIVNVTAVYSAYTIKQYKDTTRNKSSYLAMALLFIAQIGFLNLVGALFIIIYIYRFLNFKSLIDIYRKAASGRNFKILLPACMVCAIAIITFCMRLQLGLLF